MRTAKLVSAILRLLVAYLPEGSEMLAAGAQASVRLRGVRRTESLVWKVQQVVTTCRQESLQHKYRYSKHSANLLSTAGCDHMSSGVSSAQISVQ